MPIHALKSVWKCFAVYGSPKHREAMKKFMEHYRDDWKTFSEDVLAESFQIPHYSLPITDLFSQLELYIVVKDIITADNVNKWSYITSLIKILDKNSLRGTTNVLTWVLLLLSDIINSIKPETAHVGQVCTHCDSFPIFGIVFSYLTTKYL